MKRINYLRILFASLLLSGCGIINGNNGLMKIQKGMSPREVSRLLGSPSYRRFSDGGEQWEYRSYALNGHNTILIDFVDGAVVNLDSFFEDAFTSSIPVVVRQIPDNGRPQRAHRPALPEGRAMNDADFQTLYHLVKKQSFKDEMLKQLSVGILHNRFSCRQCAQMMSLFTFDDDRLKVVDLMADRLIDREHTDEILGALSFQLGKKKALQRLDQRPQASADKDDYRKLYESIRRESFDDRRIEVLKAGIGRGRFTCQQCAQLISLCTFDDKRLKMVSLLSDHIIDPENWKLVVNSFTHHSNKEEARKLLGR